MRPLKINGEEVGWGCRPMVKNSLVPAVQELWNEWEIHCLILVSLFLQVFLFLFAGMRRSSSSRVLSTVLWLAYLSADFVAIFVLGHLAVHASEPGHQLMSLWAPFLLVHLGGQDTITALSRQDNELWMRHLLSLVSQVAVAGYVVGKASWQDPRLMASMVLMFLSGCFKYIERTLCLYCSSPAKLRSHALSGLSYRLKSLQDTKDEAGTLFDFWMTRNQSRAQQMRMALEKISEGNPSGSLFLDETIRDILSVDVPLNDAEIVSFAEDHLPGILKHFRSSAGRYKVYEHVGAVLVDFYLDLYTKSPLRKSFSDSYYFIREYVCHAGPCGGIICCALCCISQGPYFLYNVFQYVAAPIALVLFWAAEKGGQQHSSGPDIVVSYILLIGSIVLTVSAATVTVFSNHIQLPGAWSQKQWSEELAQYSMIRRHVGQDTSGIASVQRWIGTRLGSWGVGLLDLTHTSIKQDHTPIKEFILDILLDFGTRKKWNIASSRGRQGLEEWMDKHRILHIIRPTKRALVKTTSNNIDFPTSVLIWHIATDICYYFGEDDASTSSDQQLMKHKKMSRELSNYITYLVFKCGVMLTTNSELVHEEAHHEIKRILSGESLIGEKQAIMKLFVGWQALMVVEIQEHQRPAGDENAASKHIERLQQRAKALDSPVLPRARAVAQELIDIVDETERWHLIFSVWSEMLFYTAPRCGGAFHYEHLSTGGEFITHVLLLMRSLGPFLPSA